MLIVILPENRMKMISEKEIADLPDDSTNLYKRNILIATLIELLLK